MRVRLRRLTYILLFVFFIPAFAGNWRYVRPAHGTAARRARFLRRLARQIDYPQSTSGPSLDLFVSALARADLDPITWLKLNAPYSARALIDEVEAGARAKHLRVLWGASGRRRAWRSYGVMGLELPFHAGSHRPVAIMLFHLLHELAHEMNTPEPQPGMTLEAYGQVIAADDIDEELRVRLLEPAFAQRIAAAGLKLDLRDVSPESPRIWAAHDAGAAADDLRQILVPKYGHPDLEYLRDLYLKGYAPYDAARVARVLGQTAAIRADEFRAVVAESPAFAIVGGADFVTYVDRVLDRLDGRVGSTGRRRTRSELLRLRGSTCGPVLAGGRASVSGSVVAE